MCGCLKGLGKLYLIFINFVVAIAGISVAGFAGLIWANQVAGSSAIPTTLTTMIVTLGLIIFLSGGLGVAGAWFRNRVYVYTYLIITLLALLYNLSVAIDVYYEKSNATTAMTLQWASESESSRAKIQDEFGCCGLTAPDDRPATSKLCVDNFDPTSYNASNTLILPDPCLPKLVAYVGVRYPKIYIALFGIVLLELLGLINGCIMLYSAKRGSKEDSAERWSRRKSAMKLEDDGYSLDGYANPQDKNQSRSPYIRKDDYYERSWVNLND